MVVAAAEAAAVEGACGRTPRSLTVSSDDALPNSLPNNPLPTSCPTVHPTALCLTSASPSASPPTVCLTQPRVFLVERRKVATCQHRLPPGT
jgi:hypothetical protein